MSARGLKVLGAAAAGAGLAYLFDPDRGHSRRAKLRDRAGATFRKERRAIERRAHYERGRMAGVRHRMRHHAPDLPETDRVLVDKVRSEVIGRMPAATPHVSVDACDGVVTLRGQLDDHDTILDLRDAVAAVSGVERVQNYLHTPDRPAPNTRVARRTEGSATDA